MKDFYIILDNIRSLENIGSIFRTADAVGTKKIFLCGISAKPSIGQNHRDYVLNNPVIKKTALGAEKNVPFEYHRQIGRLIDKLKKSKIQIVALEQSKKAVPYKKFKPKFPLALIVGNEVKGVSESVLKKSDKIIELPMKGKKESLNVAVATGIACYQILNP